MPQRAVDCTPRGMTGRGKDGYHSACHNSLDIRMVHNSKKFICHSIGQNPVFMSAWATGVCRFVGQWSPVVCPGKTTVVCQFSPWALSGDAGEGRYAW
jgi:hypothetical protein